MNFTSTNWCPEKRICNESENRKKLKDCKSSSAGVIALRRNNRQSPGAPSSSWEAAAETGIPVCPRAAAPEPPVSTARLCSFSVVVTVPNLALLRMRNWVVSEIENSLMNMSLQVVGCQKRPVAQTNSVWRIVAVLRPTWAVRRALCYLAAGLLL